MSVVWLLDCAEVSFLRLVRLSDMFVRLIRACTAASPAFFQSVLHEKALAEQMFADLQQKLTDQFRAESDAKEAEISALKAHISVLQTALDEMRRDLDEKSTLFAKPAMTTVAQPASHQNVSERNHSDHGVSESGQGHMQPPPFGKSPLTTCDAYRPAISSESERRPLQFGQVGSTTTSLPSTARLEPHHLEPHQPEKDTKDLSNSQSGTHSACEPQNASPEVYAAFWIESMARLACYCSESLMCMLPAH